MSFNFENVGSPFAIIKSDDSKKNKIVSIADDNEMDEIKKIFPKIELQAGQKFLPYPDPTPKLERQIGYITGPSGSGKSTYVKNYCREWRRQHKDKPIYLFSSLSEDPSIDDLKPARVKLDTLVTDPLDLKEVEEGSMLIFDDVDNIGNKKIRDSVYAVLNNILEIGRHRKLWCLITNHMPTLGKDGRKILNECHFVVYFPKSGSNGVNMKRLLTDYLGLDKGFMEKMKKEKTRWVTIFKTYPNFVFTENRAFSVDGE
jgi:hypothetical protein